MAEQVISLDALINGIDKTMHILKGRIFKLEEGCQDALINDIDKTMHTLKDRIFKLEEGCQAVMIEYKKLKDAQVPEKVEVVE